jgi:RecA-family ATPase
MKIPPLTAPQPKPTEERPVAQKVKTYVDYAFEFQDAIIELQTGGETGIKKFEAAAKAFNAEIARIKERHPAANDNVPSKLEVVSPSEWHDQPIPDREWYAPNLIPMRQVTIVSGDGGVGKSLWALQVGAAGAMALNTLQISPMPGRTLYLGAEDEAEEFHRRLADITTAHDRTLADLTDFRLIPLAGMDALLAVPNKAGVMEQTPLWRMVLDYARDFQPKLIVLDTVADLFGGDEIKRGQARQFIGMLRHAAIELDCAIILLAHPSQTGMLTGTGSSGSTGWSNSSRSRLYMTRPDDKNADPDLRIIKTMKINYGKTGGEIRVRWQEGAFVLDDGKPAMAEALLDAKSDRIFVDVLSMLNRQGRNVCHVPGTTYAPAVMAKLPEAEGMTKDRLTKSMNTLLRDGTIKIIKEGPASKQRQRLILEAEDFGPKD